MPTAPTGGADPSPTPSPSPSSEPILCTLHPSPSPSPSPDPTPYTFALTLPLHPNSNPTPNPNSGVDAVLCVAPPRATVADGAGTQLVAFAVTLNGRDFSNASSGFTYYEEPTLLTP